MPLIKAKDVAVILGIRPGMVGDLGKRGVIKRVDFGVYDLDSVNALAKDMEERRRIKPAEWKSSSPL